MFTEGNGANKCSEKVMALTNAHKYLKINEVYYYKLMQKRVVF